MAACEVTTLGEMLVLSAWLGMDGDSLAFECLPLQHAHEHLELNASPHEVGSKGLSGIPRRGVLLVRFLGTFTRSRIPFGVG